MKIKVNVTQEHINKGECLNPASCAIALALIDAVNDRIENFDSLSLDDESVDFYIKEPGKGTMIINEKVSDEVSEFITGFDCGEDVKPFKFTMNLGKPIPLV